MGFERTNGTAVVDNWTAGLHPSVVIIIIKEELISRTAQRSSRELMFRDAWG